MKNDFKITQEFYKWLYHEQTMFNTDNLNKRDIEIAEETWKSALKKNIVNVQINKTVVPEVYFDSRLSYMEIESMVKKDMIDELSRALKDYVTFIEYVEPDTGNIKWTAKIELKKGV